MDIVVAILSFIVEHLDAVTLLKEAIERGKKEDVMKALKASMIAASDAEMQREGIT
jgi:hypothetical protein